MHRGLLVTGVLILSVVLAGCLGTGEKKTAYSIDENGVLSLTCAPVTISEEILAANETYSKSRIVMHTEDGDVTMYLAAPKQPKAAIVYAPGAGEKLAGHEERMVRLASAGYAFLFVDTRGNGGETAGLPFGQQLIQQDFVRFEKGEMPQYYLSICDLISAERMLSTRYNIPVYSMGSSNGGRYAAVAAGVDPVFSGYVGISASDWGVRDALVQQKYTGQPVLFATSLEPSTYLSRISPRPVWIFHAENDPIIPFASGKAFFAKAGEPRTFLEFSGDHGINPDVDRQILQQWAQIYAPRG
jgi:dipeptidyl aminopeptidase/acylaminoacyl peptidase